VSTPLCFDQRQSVNPFAGVVGCQKGSPSKTNCGNGAWACDRKGNLAKKKKLPRLGKNSAKLAAFFARPIPTGGPSALTPEATAIPQLQATFRLPRRQQTARAEIHRMISSR
jgi:hypothetical protein